MSQDDDPNLVALQVAFLGPPRWSTSDKRQGSLTTVDALLLYMLCSGGPVDRLAVATRIWPDSERQQSLASLRQRIARLKQQLRRAVIVGDTVIQLAHAVSDDLSELDRGLRRDASFGQGELLQGMQCDGRGELADWLDAERLRINRRRCAVLAELAEEHASQRRVTAALAYAERLAMEDPISEHAHRRVMRLHWMRGDVGAAMAAYQRCRQALRLGADVPPSAETESLMEELGRLAKVQTMQSVRTLLPASLLRPPVTVGRERSLHTIHAAWSLARAVALSAPAGGGKSHLLHELMLESGGVYAAARPGDRQLPYSLLQRLADIMPSGDPVDQLQGLLYRETPTNELRPKVRRALLQALRHGYRAGWRRLALDDLHYADDASLAAAMSVLTEDTGMSWVIAARSGEWPASVQEWLDGPGSSMVDTVSLQPMSVDDVADLLDALQLPHLDAALAAPSLHRHSGGVPLVLLETLRAAMLARVDLVEAASQGVWPVSDRIARLMNYRVESLGSEAAALAQVTAMAGTDFSVDLAAAVLDKSRTALTAPLMALQEQHIVVNGAFTHDLLAEASLRSLPLPKKQMLHAKLARWGDRSGMPAAHIARHAEAAALWAMAGKQYLKAAHRASSAGTPALEADLAERAMQCLIQAEDTDGAFAAQLIRLRAMQQFAALTNQLEALSALHAAARSGPQLEAALGAEAAILIEDFKDDRILQAVHRARAAAGATLHPDRALSLCAIEARALARSGRHDAALAVVSSTLADARSTLVLKGTQLARVLADLGCALMSCNSFAAADELFDEAQRAARSTLARNLLQDLAMHKAWVHGYQGDIEAAAQDYEEALAHARQMGQDSIASPVSRSILARTYKELGRIDQALEMLIALRADYGGPEETEVIATADADLADLYLWLAQPQTAASVLRPLPADASPTMKRGDGVIRARLAMVAGDLPGAAALLDGALESALREGGAFGRFIVQVERTRVLPPHEAAELAEREAAASGAIGLNLTTWPLRVMACRAWLACGEVGAAADAARCIASYFDVRAVFVLYPPEVWVVVGEAFEAAGLRDEAITAFGKASRWIGEIAAPRVPAPLRQRYLLQHPVHRRLHEVLSAMRTSSGEQSAHGSASTPPCCGTMLPQR